MNVVIAFVSTVLSVVISTVTSTVTSTVISVDISVVVSIVIVRVMFLSSGGFIGSQRPHVQSLTHIYNQILRPCGGGGIATGSEAQRTTFSSLLDDSSEDDATRDTFSTVENHLRELRGINQDAEELVVSDQENV